MTILLAIDAFIIALIVIRFVQPGIIYWIRDLVVAGQVNRRLMAAVDSGMATPGDDFRRLLERRLRYHVVNSSTEEIKVRCLRIREVLGIMTARVTDSPGLKKVDLGGPVVELADMLQNLGSRLRAGLDSRFGEVTGGEELLLEIVKRSGVGQVPSDTEGLETWLTNNYLSVEQIGELLVAATYALASREEVLKKA